MCMDAYLNRMSSGLEASGEVPTAGGVPAAILPSLSAKVRAGPASASLKEIALVCASCVLEHVLSCVSTTEAPCLSATGLVSVWVGLGWRHLHICYDVSSVHPAPVNAYHPDEVRHLARILSGALDVPLEAAAKQVEGIDRESRFHVSLSCVVLLPTGYINNMRRLRTIVQNYFSVRR